MASEIGKIVHCKICGKMCEFIKRPQTVQQSSEVNTDIVQSAASIALQEIMDMA